MEPTTQPKRRIKLNVASANGAVLTLTPAGEAAQPTEKAPAATGLAKAKAAAKRPSRAKVTKGETEVEQMAADVNAAQAATEKAAKRKGKKAAPEAPPFEPAVYKDDHQHSVIAVAATAKQVELIPMDSAGMSVITVSRDRFAHDYTQVMQDGAPYPVAKAAKVYLTQTIALDPKAKLLLETLAAAEADKPIASGVLVDLMSRHDKELAEQRAAAAAEAAPGEKAPRAKAAKPARERKPVGGKAAPAEAAKKIEKGGVEVHAKVQPGSFRAARHNYIVSMAGKTVAEVLGATTMEGKRAIAMRDIQFAVSHGFIKLV
jgi:hypothetical protein